MWMRLFGVSESKIMDISTTNAPGRREYAHQLLKGLGRLLKIEGDIHRMNILKVGREGCKMIRIKPLPGWRLP
jgi:streptomycin 6-kinase